jgi:hypothetical protein
MSLVRQHRSLLVPPHMSQLVPKHTSLLVPPLPDDTTYAAAQHMS